MSAAGEPLEKRSDAATLADGVAHQNQQLRGERSSYSVYLLFKKIDDATNGFQVSAALQQR